MNPRPTWFRLGPSFFPLVVMSLVVFVIPILEIAGGNCPGANLDPTASAAPRLSDGSLMKAIERGYAQHSICAKALRPRYLELLWLGFGQVTEKVFVGSERVLFESSIIDHYPPPGASDTVREHVRLIGSLARSLDAFGSALWVAPVPSKALVCVEQIPGRTAADPSIYPELIAGLRSERVRVVDLLEPLRSVPGGGYFRNDSHWNDQGALACAVAVRTELVRALGAEVPGAPRRFDLQEHRGETHRGDLQRMLGFHEGGWLDREFSVPRTRLEVRPSPIDPSAPILVCGTSFSRSFQWQRLLAYELGRSVADGAVAGQGPMVKLQERVESSLAGREPWPRLIIWEFPEKHLFTRNQEFLVPLRALVARLEERANR